MARCWEGGDVALGSLQTSEPPPFAEAPALFLRQRLPLDVIVECDPSPRPQELSAAPEESGAMRDVTPGI